jgi:hypothetical protein
MTSGDSGTVVIIARPVGGASLGAGYFWVIWRIDDVATLSGDRLSTAVVESAILALGHGRGGGL